MAITTPIQEHILVAGDEVSWLDWVAWFVYSLLARRLQRDPDVLIKHRTHNTPQHDTRTPAN